MLDKKTTDYNLPIMEAVKKFLFPITYLSRNSTVPLTDMSNSGLPYPNRIPSLKVQCQGN